MRSRRSANEQVAEVARRRLELLSAELAAIRSDPVDPPSQQGRDGSGEPLDVGAGPTGPGRHARRSVGASAAASGWIQDRLPPTLQGRVQMGASHLSVVAVLVAVALGVTAWWTVQANDPGELVPTLSPAGSPAGSQAGQEPTSLLVTPSTMVPPAPFPAPGTVGSPPAGSLQEVGEIVVDVSGKVRSPGIARLAFGSRVVDAIETAGGVRRGVDLGSLNLARVLVDGEQVLVGVPPCRGSPPPLPRLPARSARSPRTSRCRW